MYVCICNAVTDKAIKKAVKQGCNSFDKVCQKLDVGTCCGQCKPQAREIVSEALSNEKTPIFYPIVADLALTNLG
ncbi:(2Fe-2S)-binding protein [Leucothrix sargassi]|nr:(2Fe-2S)-binding protein [Leucothrix sargassi]